MQDRDRKYAYSGLVMRLRVPAIKKNCNFGRQQLRFSGI